MWPLPYVGLLRPGEGPPSFLEQYKKRPDAEVLIDEMNNENQRLEETFCLGIFR